MPAALVGAAHPKKEGENTRHSQILIGVTALVLGILSTVPGIRATQPSQVDANQQSGDANLWN
jgi:hypothetical protein